MAKQTFTTGQVLTAAQMTSLQQTAMLGGEASAKTASYTLVAADAGTAISMSNASATTITVNTALFAAGDTVQITNLGAGVCTITAGTATVNTASSLALAQYESGTLDFTSTSSAIFIKGAGAAPTASGANWSLLNAGGTALTGAGTITVSGISGKDKIMVLIDNGSSASANSQITMRLNADSGSNYASAGFKLEVGATYSTNLGNVQGGLTAAAWPICRMASNAASNIYVGAIITGCNSSGVKVIQSQAGVGAGGGSAAESPIFTGFWNNSATVTSVSIISSIGNWDSGTIYVYTSAS